MKYFIDSEFVDDGRTIDLISIGIVAEDGRELYLQSCEFDPRYASEWVNANVITHLAICPHCTQPELSRYANHIPEMIRSQILSLSGHEIHGQCTFERITPEMRTIGAYADCFWRTRSQIKNEILAFMDIEQYGKPELWGYYSSYDHVAFCQVFGTMIDLPNGFPMLTYDLRQWLDMQGMKDVCQPDDAPHHALEDARWIAQTYMRVSQGSSRS